MSRTTEPVTEESVVQNSRRHSNWAATTAGVVIVLLVAGTTLAGRRWPFARANVIAQLEQTTSSHVQFGSFQKTYFPHPGCVAENVVLQRGSQAAEAAVIRVERLTVVGSFRGLFTQHLALIRLDRARAVFPTFRSGPSWQPMQSKIAVDELEVNGSTLEFARQNGGSPHVRFLIEQFLGHHLASHDAMQFQLKIQNPMPSCEVSARGVFGPWNMEAVGATPIAGNYSFENADLSAFKGIQGILASKGNFRGTLRELAVGGSTNTPDFGLRDTGHKIVLNTRFRAQVAPRNGDVALPEVRAELLRTIISGKGGVSKRPGTRGKAVTLDFVVRNGRIEDLMLLFIKAPHAPLNGSVSLRAKASVPPGEAPLLKKLEMSGDFGINGVSLTNENTQQSLDKLSSAGRGEPAQQRDPARVVSDLEGHAEISRGIAHFSDLRFRVPGARARLSGSFDLTSHKIDLRGILSMDSNLPKATSGIKSFLLKAIDPFLKKNHRGGARFPIRITGTYEVPVYRSDPM